MADAAKPFAFSQLVPGFDFLKSLTGGGSSGSVPGLPSLSSWIAPTLSVEELDKRISELKTVQYWLEQNVHALKATIQALEVQKMTLSTLRGMNVQMEDLAKAFTRSTSSVAAAARDASASAPAPKPAPAPPPPPVARIPEPELDEQDDEDEDEEEVDDRTAAASAQDAPAPAAGKAAAGGPGVVDPLQWWNSLTQQFQQIASNALQDASQLKMPSLPAGLTGKKSAAKPAATKKAAPAKKAAARRKAPAKKAAAKKRPASGAARSRGR